MLAKLRRALFLSPLLYLANPVAVVGQGVNPPIVMHTGSGNPLSTLQVLYTGDASAMLNIDFGFATQEQPQPGAFLDSFTISITGPGGTGYLVTVDGSGILWAPSVPGALPVSDSSIQRQTSPFLASMENLPTFSSYTLDFLLPPAWQGVPLTLNFDLFDNQDPFRSFGYFLVPVPEPSAAALLLVGLFMCRLVRRR